MIFLDCENLWGDCLSFERPFITKLFKFNLARKEYFGQNAEISDFCFPLRRCGWFGLYWACGIELYWVWL